MKNEDFILMETCLSNAYDCLDEALQTCDTSKHDDEYEKDTEINDWNKRFNEVMNQIQELRMEMIFTFRIEGEE